MLERSPAVIVRCTGIDDVRAAMQLARDHDLPVAVRGGGHNIAATAGVDDGLVIDLTPITTVVVDLRPGVLEPGGATWANVDGATQARGLAAAGGAVSETGIGALTLSGGLGWLRRKHGLTCDNLVAATLVTADGAVHHVDEHHEPADRSSPDLGRGGRRRRGRQPGRTSGPRRPAGRR